MANRDPTGGRVTKTERRTQARMERAALQRKMDRAKRTRRIGIIVAVLATVDDERLVAELAGGFGAENAAAHSFAIAPGRFPQSSH